jgi:hypothetical protein
MNAVEGLYSALERADRRCHIRQEALSGSTQHPKFAHAAFLLETPQKDHAAHARNLDVLRAFVEPM